MNSLLTSSCAPSLLAGLFSDRMVLQQNMPVPIWGWAEAGDTITVSFGDQSQSTIARDDETWDVRLSPMPASATPRVLTVQSAIGNQQRKILNVLVGEVWLCSGQSNMGVPIRACSGSKEALSEADDDQLRWFRITPSVAEHPALDVAGTWVSSCAEAAAEYSAVAWNFAHRLRKELNVPVGLLHVSRGGATAETFIRQAALRSEPALAELLDEFDSAVADPAGAQTAYLAGKAGMTAWEAATAPHDPGNTAVKQGWAAPETDTTDWGTMQLPGYWQMAGEVYSGVFWFRKTIEIPPAWNQKALRLQLVPFDKDDVTYFNGVEVGSIRINERKDAWAVPRDYLIEPEQVKAGSAVIAVRVMSHMHMGGLPGPAELMRLCLADDPDTEALPLAGEWMWRVEHNFGYAHLPVKPREPMWPLGFDTPSSFYNAMIAPLIPYAMQGVIWYQGESNADHRHPEWYRTLMPLLIRDWRNLWARDFSFLIVQLPNYKGRCDAPQESCWAEVREAQRLALSEPHTGLVVTLDLGEAGNLHPSNKRDIGHRLAGLALADTYGIDGIVPCGPRVREVIREGESIRIHFDHAEGLFFRGARRSEFAVAGKDRAFVWADTARIDGATVLLTTPAVPHPVVVRYAWADNPECLLYNAADLPATPFEMDVLKQV